MGSSQSIPEKNPNDEPLLKEELESLNKIVTKLVTHNDMFADNEYNFLSEDVCEKYQVVLESDLNKMLKMEIKSLGESLLLIPRDEEQKLLQQKNMKKNEICTKIANHYIKILYVLCLIKYVYNLEKFGDLSLAGIIFRNIHISKNMFTVKYCKQAQKDLKRASGHEALNLDFSRLEGFKFFIEYFLEKDEAAIFLKVFRHIFARKSKGVLRKDLCEMGNIKEIEDLYQRRYNEKLICQAGGGDINIFVEADNPLFESTWCYAEGTVTIPLAESDGKEAYQLYKAMRSRYNSNIKEIEKILMHKLVDKHLSGKWALKDINKTELDDIIREVKDKVKVFYLQSISDFQDLLDRIKTFPNAIVV